MLIFSNGAKLISHSPNTCVGTRNRPCSSFLHFLMTSFIAGICQTLHIDLYRFNSFEGYVCFLRIQGKEKQGEKERNMYCMQIKNLKKIS